MKKSTLHFGEFRQYDKVFLTADKGIDVENVLDVAFDGEILYIAQADELLEYAEGKIKKISASNIKKKSGLFHPLFAFYCFGGLQGIRIAIPFSLSKTAAFRLFAS